MPQSAHHGFTGHETATAVSDDAVIYHRTTVARRVGLFGVELAHGGRITATTARRMNQALATWGIPGNVYREGGSMWYSRHVPGYVPVEIDHDPAIINP